MSAMEVSIKWKERSGAPSANGTSKRANTTAVFFGPMNFSSLPNTGSNPPQHGSRLLKISNSIGSTDQSPALFRNRGRGCEREFLSHNLREGRGGISRPVREDDFSTAHKLACETFPESAFVPPRDFLSSRQREPDQNPRCSKKAGAFWYRYSSS